MAYFYDPNIHPEQEYLDRLQEAREWAAEIDLPLLEAPYDMQTWFAKTKGHEHAPEGGIRCSICYEMRMEHAAQYAVQNGFDLFTTVLSVSPKKKTETINRIGLALAKKYGIDFLAADFKKSGGADASVELSKWYGLERQNYCGCVFSQRDNKKQ